MAVSRLVLVVLVVTIPRGTNDPFGEVNQRTVTGNVSEFVLRISRLIERNAERVTRLRLQLKVGQHERHIRVAELSLSGHSEPRQPAVVVDRLMKLARLPTPEATGRDT